MKLNQQTFAFKIVDQQIKFEVKLIFLLNCSMMLAHAFLYLTRSFEVIKQ